MVSSIKQVLIPSAGIGSRLGSLTKNINKALIQIDGKAVISHIIDLYPENYEFIICLGHKGDLLRQYLEISHPKTKFKFVNIDKFDEGDCTNSIYNGISITIDFISNNPKKVRIFGLRSFGESLHHSITDGSLEFGYQSN